MRTRFGRMLGPCLVAGLLGTATAATPEPEAGTWQRHELQFQYMGFTTIYSCDGLVAKLQLLLKAAGARDDAKVSARSCSEIGGRPDRFASAKLVFHTLAAAKPDDAEAVPAQWRKVRLANNRPLDFATGDCELAEQFRDEVLRKTFATRNTVDRLTCVPHQGGHPFTLDVEVLSAVKPDGKR